MLIWSANGKHVFLAVGRTYPLSTTTASVKQHYDFDVVIRNRWNFGYAAFRTFDIIGDRRTAAHGRPASMPEAAVTSMYELPTGAMRNTPLKILNVSQESARIYEGGIVDADFLPECARLMMEPMNDHPADQDTQVLANSSAPLLSSVLRTLQRELVLEDGRALFSTFV